MTRTHFLIAITVVTLSYTQIPGVDFSKKCAPGLSEMAYALAKLFRIRTNGTWMFFTASIYCDLETDVYKKVSENETVQKGPKSRTQSRDKNKMT